MILSDREPHYSFIHLFYFPASLIALLDNVEEINRCPRGKVCSKAAVDVWKLATGGGWGIQSSGGGSVLNASL